MTQPSLTGLTKEQLGYIEYLEKRLQGLTNNGSINLMAALNEKFNTLAKQIRETDIDFSKSDDKLYERFLNTAKISRDLLSDFSAFIREYGDEIKDETNKKIPLIERLAASKVPKTA